MFSSINKYLFLCTPKRMLVCLCMHIFKHPTFQSPPLYICLVTTSSISLLQIILGLPILRSVSGTNSVACFGHLSSVIPITCPFSESLFQLSLLFIYFYSIAASIPSRRQHHQFYSCSVLSGLKYNLFQPK